MYSRLLLYGVLLALIWNTENAESVLLTATLMTGFMGGYLIGRLPLGTFLSVLSNNGTSVPQIPSLNLPTILPSFPSLVPREESQTVKASGVSDSNPSSAPPVAYVPTAAPPNVPYIYTYNYPVAYQYPMQTFVTSSSTTPTPEVDPSVKLSLFPIKPVDVPISLDNKIRDRFIRQLAIMDPLNCLPKIFCEVSADPYGATVQLDHGTITNVGPLGQDSIKTQELVAYELHLQRQRTTTTTPQPTTSTSTAATVQNEEPEKDDSASEEEEDDVSAETEEDDDSFEQYKKEHEHKIEMQALEELVDEIDDPQTYMYILRDKKRRKESRKKYKQKQRNKASHLESSPGPGSFREADDIPLSDVERDLDPLELFPPTYDIPDYNDEAAPPFINRRMSENHPGRPPPMEPPPRFLPSMLMGVTEPPLHDMFADDPFFDDFPGGSSRRFRAIRGNLKSRGNRRGRSQNVQKEDLMTKYNVAYMVAEKYRSPDMCGVAFPSCPYRAKTILSVVNRMESGLLPFKLSSDKKKYPNERNTNNIDHFKNTLQAIERLNKATLEAQARGEPFNIEQVAEIASSPLSKFNANTSQNIVHDFQQVVAKIKTEKLKKRKKHKRKKPVKNRTQYDAVHYYKKAQMEELKPKERVQAGIVHTKEPVRQQDDELQMKSQWSDVPLPSFKQTYKEMFKASKLTTARPKWNNRWTANSSKVNTTAKVKTVTTSETKPVTKFSEIVEEDDERDARESEEALTALITHGRRHRSPLK